MNEDDEDDYSNGSAILNELNEVDVQEIKQWLAQKLKSIELSYQNKVRDVKPIVFEEARKFIKEQGQRLCDALSS